MQLLEVPTGEPSNFPSDSHLPDSPWLTTAPSETDAPVKLVSHITLYKVTTIEYTSVTKVSLGMPVETPTDTLRTTLLQALRRVTNPRTQFPYLSIDPTETLRSALILRCYFHISQGLSDHTLEEISLLPPFLPDKASVNSNLALESWSSWIPLPRVSPSFCDPFTLLLSGILDQRMYFSYLSPAVDDTGRELDAFIHEYYGAHEGCEKGYYCLYDNCVYNMGPVAVCREGFKRHLRGYHGVEGL